MLTAILADDEEIVRSSMEKWIPWEELGIKLIGSARDGEEAYEMALSLNPDIVMTDIKMPRTDGLELIRKLTDEKKDIAFIILSGFSEFEYAQRAMSYGVKHYLLKPVLKEDLEKTLLSVKSEIEEKHKEKNSQRGAEDRYSFYIQRGMLMEVLSDETLVEPIIERSRRIASFNPDEILTMIVIKAPDADRFISSMLPAIRKREMRMPVHPIAASGRIFLILDISSLSFLDELRNDIESRSGVVIDVQRGTPAELIHKFLKEARASKDAAIYDDEGHREIVRVLPRVKDDGEALVERYRKVLSGGEDATLLDDAEKIFSSMELDEAESLFVLMAMKNTDYTLLFKELGNVKSMEDLISLARSFIDHRIPGERDVFPVETVRKYIAENFSNPDISLKWISENVVYMNPEYLSRLFQREMGQRFTDYLNTTRVNEACKLMSVYHQSTVSEIAEKVGYSNPGYFFHIFRRYTGMTPGEYMEKNRKGNENE